MTEKGDLVGCMAPPSPDLSLFNSDFRQLSFTDHQQQHQMQDMEEMDIDFTVLDTPDRFCRQKTNRGGNAMEEDNSSTMVGSSGSVNILDSEVHNREKDRSKLKTEDPFQRRLFSARRGQADTGFNRESQKNSHHVVDLVGSPSASTNASWNEKNLSRKVCSQEHVGSRDDRAKLDGGTSSITELLAEEDKLRGKMKGKRSCLTPRSKMASNSLCLGGNNFRKNSLHRGNTSSSVDDSSRSSAAVCTDRGKMVPVPSYSRQNTEPSMSRSLQPTMVPKKNGQRRLVRNGCISPNNIAKATGTAESNRKVYESGKLDDFDNVVSQFEALPSHVQVISPSSGGRQADRVKGKGVMEECSAHMYDNEISNPSSRNLPNVTEEANMNKDAHQFDMKTFEGNSGWRSTRNRSNSTSSILSDGARHLSSTNDGLGRSNEVSDPVSLQCGSTAISAQASSGIRSEMDRGSRLQSGTSKIACRQKKRGSICNNSGECSSYADDPDVSFLWASEENQNARATRTRSNRRRGNLHPIIEIDDTSNELQNTSQMANDESEARARQLEADEMLARELQEQLYHEVPGVGIGEVDANIAWTLQHEEEAQHASSLRRQRVNSRDASVSHLYRQHQTQALQNSLTRASRGGLGRGRASNSARMTRLRERILSTPRTLSSTDRNIHFHPNIDVDMRIHILEQLEAALGASEMAAPNSFFQLDRDFNENDYEMLLALDDNNHQHVGANSSQIDGLPQSTVQSENYTEVCAVCLETPTIGDTVRHLPCLHKFHKDCIDPWLRRKTSCPICKSGIT